MFRSYFFNKNITNTAEQSTVAAMSSAILNLHCFEKKKKLLYHQKNVYYQNKLI